MLGRGKIPDGVPAYEFIKRELKHAIDTGALQEGARVPSELDYARALNVSRGQTRQALRELELEGYLLRYPGRGSFVAPASERTHLAGIQGLHMVAMACPIISSFHVRAVIEGFSTRLQAENIMTVTYFLGVNAFREAQLLSEIRRTGVEGLALWKDMHGDAEAEQQLLAGLGSSRFPLVLCDRYIEGFEADFVGTDNERLGYDLTRALLEEGHTAIAFLTLSFDITTSRERLTGYKRALAEAGISVTEAYVCELGMAAGESDAVVTELLACQRRPTALICTDDRGAAAVFGALDRRGYRVPEDMVLACVNDDDSLERMGLQVLQARQQSKRIGCETAEVLLARIAEPGRAAERRLIPAAFPVSQTRQRSSVRKGGERTQTKRYAHSSASVCSAGI